MNQQGGSVWWKIILLCTILLGLKLDFIKQHKQSTTEIIHKRRDSLQSFIIYNGTRFVCGQSFELL